MLSPMKSTWQASRHSPLPIQVLLGMRLTGHFIIFNIQSSKCLSHLPDCRCRMLELCTTVLRWYITWKVKVRKTGAWVWSWNIPHTMLHTKHKLNPLRADSGYIRATNVVPFCGFLFGSHVRQRTDNIAGTLLVLPLSETVVIRVG